MASIMAYRCLYEVVHFVNTKHMVEGEFLFVQIGKTETLRELEIMHDVCGSPQMVGSTVE